MKCPFVSSLWELGHARLRICACAGPLPFLRALEVSWKFVLRCWNFAARKQNVCDPSDKKIGEIMDVLVDREGKATALIISVGGFLGAGSKDVAVPFNAVHTTNKGNNKWYLVMNADKDSLKNAKGFKYDRNAMAWMPEETPATTGSPAAPAPRPSNR
jgi:hypothetical protein